VNHQPPDYEYKYGHSEIIKEKLFLGGEDDVDDLLYGTEEARHLNGKGSFSNQAFPQIDTWIDLRDNRPSNRQIYIPEGVQYVSIPFRDGFLDEARVNLPLAEQVLRNALNANQKVLVTCHQGRSRSVILLLWYFAKKEGSFLDAYWLIKGKRPIMNPDKNFKPLIDEWRKQYPAESNTW